MMEENMIANTMEEKDHVALLWTFSIIIASVLFATDQTVLPYSKCGLTRLVEQL
jgi:hypothetical protein